MMSISPSPGHSFGPSIQNAGQYPTDLAGAEDTRPSAVSV
jgi:hypothetical protein